MRRQDSSQQRQPPGQTQTLSSSTQQQTQTHMQQRSDHMRPTPQHSSGTRLIPSSPSPRSPVRFLLSSLLLLLCFGCSAVSAQNDVTAYFSTGTRAQSLSVYGDTPLFRTPLILESFTGAIIRVMSVTASDPSSFMTLDPTTPVPVFAFSAPETMQIIIDPSAAVAGIYVQNFTVSGFKNSGGTPTPPFVLSLTVTVQADLLYTTVNTDSITGVANAEAPYNMTEGTDYTQTIKLRSQPSATVTLTVTANQFSADLPNFGRAPQGQAWRGGGPLLSLDASAEVSTVALTFTTADWNVAQNVLVRALSNATMQGPRQSSVAFTFVSADTFYAALTLPTIDVLIYERDLAQFEISSLNLTLSASDSTLMTTTVVPTTTTSQSFEVRLGAQPLADMTISLPSQGRYSISPSSLTFTPSNYASPRTVTLTFSTSFVLVGTLALTQVFPAASSADADFAGLTLRRLQVTFLDVNNVVASLSPPFAYYLQDATAPVYLTMSWDAPRTFLPSAAGETALPEVSCVFGNNFGCDGGVFFGGSTANCLEPYAQILVAGSVISPTQISCPIPSCPSSESDAASGGIPSTDLGECDGSYAVMPLINGQAASASLPFVYLLPVISAERPQPQINAITPDIVDVNGYEWITLHGVNFQTMFTYPNPTSSDTAAEPTGTGTKLVTCRIGGINAPLVDVSGTELNDNQETVPVIKCLSRPRPDLAGSTDKVPVYVEVSLNGQEFTSNNQILNLFDYAKQTYNNSWTYFFIAVALVGLLFAIMILQHGLCQNFWRTRKEEEETAKIRVTKGPQMLIDLLEPQVHAQSLAQREIEKAEAAANRVAAQDEVKRRIQEIQRETAFKKEEKKRLRAEKKAAKEAAKIADAARQEVLAAAGLAPEQGVEMSSIDAEKEEKKRRKREKKEAAAAAAAAAAALSSGAESGMESDGDALASPSYAAGTGAAAFSDQDQQERKDPADFDAQAAAIAVGVAGAGAGSAVGLERVLSGGETSGHSSEDSQGGRKTKAKKEKVRSSSSSSESSTPIACVYLPRENAALLTLCCCFSLLCSPCDSAEGQEGKEIQERQEA